MNVGIFNSRTPIKAYDVTDTIRKYGKSDVIYEMILDKLQKDLNRRNKAKRENVLNKSYELFKNNYEFFNENDNNTLDYLCIMAKLEKDERYSDIKFQFYHLFKKMLNV
jgi:hypothetical protein